MTRRRPATATLPGVGAAVVSVLPDVAGLDRTFDYVVPDGFVGDVGIGTLVRADLAGRRVGGWVVAADVEPPDGLALRPLLRRTGWGPPADVVDLAAWAAWRWAGRRRSLLATASAPHAVPALPAPDRRPPAPPASTGELAGLVADATRATVGVVRLPPAADPTVAVALVAQRGPTLVVVPSAARAAVLARRLRLAGAGVAELPGAWAQARAGAGIVVGARAAAWAPCPGLAAVVVVDAHDEALTQEQAPTWWAALVAAERARRAGVPCLWITPCPTLDLLAAGRLVTPSVAAERAGWAPVEVVDRRGDDPRLGLYSDRLVRELRSTRRVLCVLNRTGRARLLACGACGELARCERCGAAVAQAPGVGEASGAGHTLVCRRCATTRPPVCAVCDSSRLRLLRVGVTRVREELEALVGRPVTEVTAASPVGPDAGEDGVAVGTEAVLHRAVAADLVAFLDFDQELLAPRFRAGEEALALLARAARLVGGRRRDGRLLVQTRSPHHDVLRAAVHADPGLLATAESGLRRALGLPPERSLAAVSGPAADAYVATLPAGAELAVTRVSEDRWLVRAADSTRLADALAGAARPAGRLRVEVDPQRV